MNSLAESPAQSDLPIIATRTAYEASAAAWAGRWEDKTFIAPRFDRFRDLLSEGARVLDLGCGPGLDAREHSARSLQVVGVDLTRAMLDYARGRSGLARCIHGDLRHLPFADRSFDGVWASASLLHLPKDQVDGALGEVSRIVRPAGVFYTAMKLGDHDAFQNARPGHPVHGRRYFAHYQPGEWTQRLRDAGFDLIEQHLENLEALAPDTPWIVTYARDRRRR